MFRGKTAVITKKKALGGLWKLVLLPTVLALVICLTVVGMKTYSISPDFADFVETFEKSYESNSEFVYRQSVFQENLARIAAFNAQNQGFTLGPNEFSDRTEEEMRWPTFPANETDHKAESSPRKGLFAAPNDLDWSAAGVITVVKNERNCKSSWIFAPIAAAESLFAIENQKDKLLVAFSEQAVFDCCPINNIPCQIDGRPQDAFTCMVQEGLALEAQYPYEAQQYMCRDFTPAFAVKGGQALASGSYSAIIAALEENPIVVSLDASTFEFQQYKSGIFTSETCSTTAPNHSMLLVGFNTTSTPPYYKLKNNWGPVWGENGYVRVAMNMQDGPGVCGIQSSPLTPLRAT